MESVTALHPGKQTMYIRWIKGLLLSFIMMMSVFVTPHDVSAHAVLVDAVPPANAELTEAPSKVVLTFNERLEEGLASLKVIDSNKKPVTDNKAQINAERTTVTIDLPKLGQGSYLVTYHVISADGHPVEGTYLFAVGQSLSQQPIDAGTTMEHLHTHGLTQGIGFTDIVQFISRIAYYAFMLAFTGWVLWSRLGGIKREGTLSVMKGWSIQLQRGYLIAFIFLMFTHLFAMIGDGGPEALVILFTQTSIGYIWIISLALSLLGFVLLYRNLWLDLLWVLAIWLCKSLNGHAAAFQPQGQTIMLDVIHLAAASLWIGGLLMLLVLWRQSREEASALFPRVSTTALVSIAVLVVSGIFSVLIFLPDYRYIVETQWGILLLVKIGLVLFVIGTGAFMRFIYRKKGLSHTIVLLKIDACLALLIIGIVGVFTYLTPLPVNEPLNWHVMGDKIHMTTQITPDNPGVNDFTVKVWLPEALGKPKQVVLKLKDNGSPDIAPLEVPLVYTEDTTVEEAYGMKKYTYKARGAYLPYPGYWSLEVRVMDSNDDETVYNKQIRLY
jgi:copper transport protein